MVIEDNPNDAELMRAVLKHSFQVEIAEDGESGFDKAIELKPTCIISDVRMPRMSGFTLLKKIRAHHDLGEIPLVLLTALDEPINKIHGYELLADLYLTKPIEPSEVLAAVKGLIRMQSRRSPIAEKPEPQSTPGSGITEDDQKFLKKLLTTLYDNIDNPDLTVDKVASLIHVTRRQLERRLKKLEKISPKEYIRQVRLEQAKKLLEEGLPSNISDLAFRVGFKDPRHFSKLYKSFFGQTPKIKS